MKDLLVPNVTPHPRLIHGNGRSGMGGVPSLSGLFAILSGFHLNHRVQVTAELPQSHLVLPEGQEIQGLGPADHTVSPVRPESPLAWPASSFQPQEFRSDRLLNCRVFWPSKEKSSIRVSWKY